jgi:hypothetical protein
MNLVTLYTNLPSNFCLQLRRPATALCRKFLHDMTTARHLNFFFVICIIRKFQLRGNNSVCAGVFLLLRHRTPAQLRGNISLYRRIQILSLVYPHHFYSYAYVGQMARIAEHIVTKRQRNS